MEPPADVWVVDIRTTLAVRVTRPDGLRTAGLDWLDRQRLIFDRLGGVAGSISSTSLRVANLEQPPGRVVRLPTWQPPPVPSAHPPFLLRRKSLCNNYL